MSLRFFVCMCEHTIYHHLDAGDMSCDACDCDGFVENIAAKALQ